VYDPGLGRFLQADPIGYADDQNLYAYVASDPVNARDPDGKVAVPLLLVGGTVLGTAVACEVSGACDDLRDAAREAFQRASDELLRVPEIAADSGERARELLMPAKEHESNKRPSNREKHEKGQERKIRDKQGGEKGDRARTPWNYSPSQRQQERERQKQEDRERRRQERESRERPDREKPGEQR
jgi:uncharacterized protein RhaS with RHS repeats